MAEKDIFEQDEEREAIEAIVDTPVDKTPVDDLEVVIEQAKEEPEEKPEEKKVEEKKPDEEAEPEDKVEADSKEDEDAEPVEGAEELDEDDRKSYSKKVQKRILRERRLARHAQEERDAERSRAFAAEMRSHDTAKKWAEFMSLSTDRDLKRAQAALRAAMEAGDSEKGSELTMEIGELQAKKREIETTKAQLDNAKPVERAPAPTGETNRWKERNRWFEHPRFQAESTYTSLIDEKLAKEGRYRVGSPEYFRELDSRIKSEMPDLSRKAGAIFRTTENPAPPRQAKADVKAAVAKSPVAAVPKGGNASQVTTGKSGKQRVVLTAADLQTMRDFKLDPSNKEHLAAFARQKLEP